MGTEIEILALYRPVGPQELALIEASDTEIPAELRDQFAIGTMEVDPPEHHEICRQLKILNLPFLAFYRAGSMTATVTGLQERKILEQLSQLLT